MPRWRYSKVNTDVLFATYLVEATASVIYKNTTEKGMEIIYVKQCGYMTQRPIRAHLRAREIYYD